VRNEGHYYHALNYLHYNPVKHGYVEGPYDWPWSSVHLYHETYGREWLRDHWVEYPVGKGWYYGDVCGVHPFEALKRSLQARGCRSNGFSRWMRRSAHYGREDVVVTASGVGSAEAFTTGEGCCSNGFSRWKR
jgi:hypothetical protein